ncbi:nuclear transport factor 2 family protein [Nonomuraea sp. NPDC002799]
MTTAVAELADRDEISSLVSRYFSTIDDKRFDRAAIEAVFTAGGRVTRPNGASLVGPEAIAAGQSESFARFRATHHVSSDDALTNSRTALSGRAPSLLRQDRRGLFSRPWTSWTVSSPGYGGYSPPP